MFQHEFSLDSKGSIDFNHSELRPCQHMSGVYRREEQQLSHTTKSETRGRIMPH